MKEEREIAIPESVVRRRDISPNSKLLFGEIRALCHKEGYCWASNAHFADFLGIDPSNVKRCLVQLKEKNMIDIEFTKSESGISRAIYCPPKSAQKCPPPQRENAPTPEGEKEGSQRENAPTPEGEKEGSQRENAPPPSAKTRHPPARKRATPQRENALCNTKENSKLNTKEEEASTAKKNKTKKNKNEQGTPKKNDDAEFVEAVEVIEEQAAQLDPRQWSAQQQAPKEEPRQFDIGANQKSARAVGIMEERLGRLSEQLELTYSISSPYRTDAQRFIRGLLMNYQQALNLFFASPAAAQFDSEELFSIVGDFYTMKAKKILEGITAQARHKPDAMALQSLLGDMLKRNYEIDFWISRVVKAVQANAEWALPFGVSTYWEAEHQQWKRSAQGTPQPAGASKNNFQGNGQAQQMSKSQQSHAKTQQILANGIKSKIEEGIRAKLLRGEHSEADYEDTPHLYLQICQELGITSPFST